MSGAGWVYTGWGGARGGSGFACSSCLYCSHQTPNRNPKVLTLTVSCSQSTLDWVMVLSSRHCLHAEPGFSGAPCAHTAYIGATLIDGMGDALVINSVMIVQGARITALGELGQTRSPRGALEVPFQCVTHRTLYGCDISAVHHRIDSGVNSKDVSSPFVRKNGIRANHIGLVLRTTLFEDRVCVFELLGCDASRASLWQLAAVALARVPWLTRSPITRAVLGIRTRPSLRGAIRTKGSFGDNYSRHR